MSESPLMNPREAAAYLGLNPQTLALWRYTGKDGIPYTRVGYSIRYRKEDLDAYLEQNRVGSLPATSQPVAVKDNPQAAVKASGKAPVKASGKATSKATGKAD